jgi:hypothetical protein
MVLAPLSSSILDELTSCELFPADTRLGIELPQLRAFIEDKYVSLSKTGCLRWDFADDQPRAIRNDADPVEFMYVGRWGRRYMVKTGGDAAVQADKLGEVGQETLRFGSLDLPVLDWQAM